MLRRTLLKILALLFVARPARALARVAQPPPFGARELDTLSSIAEIVLPSDIGRAGRQRAVDRFVAWFAGYREGADMGHGYGMATLRRPAGPSPALRYPEQFAALDRAARDRGAETFASLARPARREVIVGMLDEPSRVDRLPTLPTGANLIADFMGSYFTTADAWDRCYGAAIRRDRCRGLDDSTAAPPRLER